jgi:hypothetical protein
MLREAIITLPDSVQARPIREHPTEVNQVEGLIC